MDLKTQYPTASSILQLYTVGTEKAAEVRAAENEQHATRAAHSLAKTTWDAHCEKVRFQKWELAEKLMLLKTTGCKDVRTDPSTGSVSIHPRIDFEKCLSITDEAEEAERARAVDHPAPPQPGSSWPRKGVADADKAGLAETLSVLKHLIQLHTDAEQVAVAADDFDGAMASSEAAAEATRVAGLLQKDLDEYTPLPWHDRFGLASKCPEYLITLEGQICSIGCAGDGGGRAEWSDEWDADVWTCGAECKCYKPCTEAPPGEVEFLRIKKAHENPQAATARVDRESHIAKHSVSSLAAAAAAAMATMQAGADIEYAKHIEHRKQQARVAHYNDARELVASQHEDRSKR